jgi:HEAT repeat protein
MFRAKAQNRALKKGVDAEEARQKRVEVTVQLRKQNRDEQVMKRRGAVGETSKPDENSSATSTNADNMAVATTKLTSSDLQERVKNLPRLVEALNSNDVNRQLEAATEFRKLLSIEKNPPIQKVIDTNVVPRLVALLGCTQNETLQFEAAWTLTNIASGTTEHTQHIINHGAIQAFIQLLLSPNAEVKEQAVWALGNIAGDSPQFRDYVIQSYGVAGLLSVFRNDAKISMIRNATWSLSNLCRGKPQPKFEQISSVLPMLAKLVMMDDVEVITDAMWALSYISDDTGPTNNKIQAVIDHGVLPRLVQCLNHHQTSVQVPALRCLGNIVTGDDKQTSAALACNPLPFILGLMSHRKKGIKKEACWTVSNITAGSGEQIQRVLDANLIPPLITMLRDESFDIQKEAAWAISNATSGGNATQIRFLAESGAISALCGLFSCTDPKIIMVALEGIENILRAGKKEATKSCTTNPYNDAVEECGGLDGLEVLQRHDNEEIYDRSVRVLREHFESDETEEGSVPAVDLAKNQFSFGLLDTTPSTGYNF